MAGETLSYTELKNWYNTFNSVITNYGGGVASLAIPSQDKAKPSDINNLLNKITELAKEEYLGTQPSLYTTDYSIVASGSKIVRSASTPISNTANKLPQIKCRNKITYSNVAYTNGTNRDGQYSSSTYSNTTCSSGNHSKGYHSYTTKMCGSQSSGLYTNMTNSCGTKQNGTKTYGTCSSSTKSNTNQSNGSNSSGSIIDILNANSSY